MVCKPSSLFPPFPPSPSLSPFLLPPSPFLLPPPQEEDGDEDHTEKDRISSKQVQQSEVRLDKLVTDGTTLVTNVKVAGDSKEVSRRLEEDEEQKSR